MSTSAKSQSRKIALRIAEAELYQAVTPGNLQSNYIQQHGKSTPTISVQANMARCVRICELSLTYRAVDICFRHSLFCATTACSGTRKPLRIERRGRSSDLRSLLSSQTGNIFPFSGISLSLNERRNPSSLRLTKPRFRSIFGKLRFCMPACRSCGWQVRAQRAQ